MRQSFILASAAVAFFPSIALGQNWVTFTNNTSSRLIADASVGVSDPEEKDFAMGDFDHDGDVDLVCVRKQPFTSIGRKRNVLFMNEGIAQGHSINGVLVDRTAQYATAADDGGQGMLDLTADRDVNVTDVNGDGWLDIVTATTYGQGLPKSISHPRIYLNRGESNGTWLGFRYEQGRIPDLGGAPNFCGVGAGDVTGNKAPDLYFVDYDNITTSPFEDILLINNGQGFFTDQTNGRLTSAMTSSAFGISAQMADMNGDGKLDILKNENGPAKILYNAGGGFFTSMHNVYNGASYFSSAGDLNQDGRLDLVMSDDGTDRYMLNQGNGPSGQATFSTLSFPSTSSGFGATSRYHDMNNDGFVDVIICDVDVDASGCSRQTRLYRNLGNMPNISFQDQSVGNMPYTTGGPLQGCHDVAVIDLNQDGWLDLVLAKCTGIQVWINQPPNGLIFTYPQGLPAFTDSKQPQTFQVNIQGVGAAIPAPNSGVLFYSVNNAPFVNAPMTPISGNLYSATLPASACASLTRFYVTAQSTQGGTFRDPSNAPTTTYSAVSATGTEITIEDGFENSVSGWSVVNHASLTGGAWECAIPNGTINGGALAAPSVDNGAGEDVKCFITQNGAPNGAANLTDVDSGPTWLLSPIIDLAGTDATITYDRWFYCEDAGTPQGDLLTTEISNNGGASWVFVHSTGTTGSEWESVSFRVGQYVTPNSQIRLRFWTSDSPNDSVTEAGIDNFVVEELICGTPCAADITGDNTVNVNDLLAVINGWGPCPQPCPPYCPADATDDCAVNVNDLLVVINSWGACP